jgi:hypothetical protein
VFHGLRTHERNRRAPRSGCHTRFICASSRPQTAGRAQCERKQTQSATSAGARYGVIQMFQIRRAPSSLANALVTALVGLLTPELGSASLLTAAEMNSLGSNGSGSGVLKHSVTAAGPSRIRTGVPCFVDVSAETPTTNARQAGNVAG